MEREKEKEEKRERGRKFLVVSCFPRAFFERFLGSITTISGKPSLSLEVENRAKREICLRNSYQFPSRVLYEEHSGRPMLCLITRESSRNGLRGVLISMGRKRKRG